MLLFTLGLAACSRQQKTEDTASSSEAASSVAQATSDSSVSSAILASSSSSSQERTTAASSSLMQQQSSMDNVSSAADNSTAATAVQNFYLAWMHHSGNPLTDGFLESNLYVSSALKISLLAGNDSSRPVYCSAQKPSTFSLQAMGANAQRRDVAVTEKFRTGETEQLTVGTVKEADGWKVDSIACGASLSSASPR